VTFIFYEVDTPHLIQKVSQQQVFPLTGYWCMKPIY